MLTIMMMATLFERSGVRPLFIVERSVGGVRPAVVIAVWALFDPINKYFIGCNEHFGSKDASKYRDAMKLIAVSMSNGID
jgi:hypothetical protein